MTDSNAKINTALLEPSLLASSSQNSAMSATQNSYISPLEQTLSDLRRKYVAAAGPQVGTGNTSSVYSGDVDFDDISKRLGEEETNKSWMMLDKRRSAISNSQNLTSGYSRCISTANLSVSNRSGTINGSPRTGSKRQTSGTSPLPTEKRNLNHPSNASSSLLSGSFLDQESAAFMDSTNRHKSGLASTSHAENLLACAPHLRHLSAASAEMQGRNFKSSRNPFSYFFASTSQSNFSRETSGEGSASSNANAASMADYGTCLARDRANGRVALKLAAFVRVLSHEMLLEEFASVEAEIFSQILALMHSSDSNEALAGVAAIDALIGVPSADEEKKSTKFAKNLSFGMKAANADYLFLSGVTRSLGKIFLGSSNVDYVECEVIKAMEWLKKERSDRRYVSRQQYIMFFVSTITLTEYIFVHLNSFYFFFIINHRYNKIGLRLFLLLKN
jgi:hypothetical protein